MNTENMELPDFDRFELNPQLGLQASLREQITLWICQGRLSPGTQLPASRVLASQLGISRNTVVQVIDQLKSEGYLQSFQGKGVFVSPQIQVDLHDLPRPISPVRLNAPQSLRMKALLPSVSSPDFEAPTSPPFTLGMPDLGAFPHKIWASLVHRNSRRRALMGYDHPAGHPPLREAIAEYLSLSRGVRCHKDQILITQGAQQALFLCAWALLNAGDCVAMENPGYRRARSVFELTQAQLMPVATSQEGMNIPALMAQCRRQNRWPKMLYTTPTHQYPLGGVMPACDRMQLLHWASENGVWIIEDDYDSEFHFINKPVAAMQGMAEGTPVIYMGSFSKTLFPSLRLGYLVLPEGMMEAFCQAKNLITSDSPLLTQAVTAEFMMEGHFTRHLRRMRQLYCEKWMDFTALIDEHLTEDFPRIGQSAGMHLVIGTPGRNDIQLIQALRQEGFGGAPLSQYYLADTAHPKSALVLGFAHSSSQDRQRIIRFLREQTDASARA